ncbi:hybrid sensor histidine kinase/response regulator [Verrucomicrobiota bacterium sgz303538]
MASNPETQQSQGANQWTPWIVLLSTLACSLLVTWFVASYSAHRERNLFERNTELARLQVTYRLETYAALLRSGASFISASEEVTPEEFTRFVNRLRIDEVYPGIQGVGYTIKVSPEDRNATLQNLREKLGPEFHFWPDAPPQTDFFAIIYLEPQDARNKAAVGFDMHSDPARAEAMDAARDSGLPQLSRRVTLVQEIEKEQEQPGFLIYVPVYAAGQVPASLTERRKALRGFCYGAFRASDFFNAALGSATFRRLGLRVYDGASEDPADLLFESPPESSTAPRLNQTIPVQVAGRKWTMQFTGDAELGFVAPHVIVPFVLLSGVSVSFLLFAVTMRLARANATAARSRQLFERIAWATPDVLYVHNLLTQQNVFMNAEIQQMLGYSPEHIRELGPSWMVTLMHPDDVPIAQKYFERLATLPDGEVTSAEGRFRDANGNYRWIFTRGLVFSRAPDGTAVEVLGLGTDVTERRATEAALRDANKAKDEFLATLSHELRTPLTPVLAIISSLEKDERLHEELREEIETARRNVELEARLIDDLLDLTRIVRGKLTLHPEPVDMRDIAEHTATSVLELRHKNIDFAIDWAASESCVQGDRSRLTQLLWNLLKNAAKFTNNGNRVRLRAHNHEGGPDGRPWLVIEVEDTGVGIEPEVLPKIFNAFEQGDAHVTRRFGGLGLGLAISKAVVEMHHGKISATSDGVGKGACFTVCLPTIPRPAPLAGPTLLSNGEATDLAAAKAAGTRLLLVEDHADTAEILGKRLRRGGYQVVHAATVEAGLSAAEQAQKAGEPFDLVLSDLGLPDGTGFDLMKELSTKYGLRGVALSGFGMEADVRRSEEAGFLRHLTKPVDFELLKRVLAEALMLT